MEPSRPPGIDPADLPRDEAICNTTIQRPGAYVVEDMDADPAFRDSTWAAGSTTCASTPDTRSRRPAASASAPSASWTARRASSRLDETATLRDLALRAQAVLWEQRAAG